MEQTAADRRHIILLTDGVPAPGDYREIARRPWPPAASRCGTVSISKGTGQDLLKEMATIARGRHNHCDDPSAVPRILVQETKVAAADEGYREFRPFALQTLPGLDVASAPPLLGYAGPIPSLTRSRYCSPWPAIRCYVGGGTARAVARLYRGRQGSVDRPLEIVAGLRSFLEASGPPHARQGRSPVR